jgi:uncharacterized protein (DUF433 family)
MSDTSDLLIPPTDPVIWVNPGRVSGVPCFYGTRVPVKILFDYLAAGDPLAEFLDNFPDVSENQAKAVLRLTYQSTLAEYPAWNMAAE